MRPIIVHHGSALDGPLLQSVEMQLLALLVLFFAILEGLLYGFENRVAHPRKEPSRLTQS